MQAKANIDYNQLAGGSPLANAEVPTSLPNEDDVKRYVEATAAAGAAAACTAVGAAPAAPLCSAVGKLIVGKVFNGIKRLVTRRARRRELDRLVRAAQAAAREGEKAVFEIDNARKQAMSDIDAELASELEKLTGFGEARVIGAGGWVTGKPWLEYVRNTIRNAIGDKTEFGPDEPKIAFPGYKRIRPYRYELEKLTAVQAYKLLSWEMIGASCTFDNLFCQTMRVIKRDSAANVPPLVQQWVGRLAKLAEGYIGTYAAAASALLSNVGQSVALAETALEAGTYPKDLLDRPGGLVSKAALEANEKASKPRRERFKVLNEIASWYGENGSLAQEEARTNQDRIRIEALRVLGEQKDSLSDVDRRALGNFVQSVQLETQKLGSMSPTERIEYEKRHNIISPEPTPQNIDRGSSAGFEGGLNPPEGNYPLAGSVSLGLRQAMKLSVEAFKLELGRDPSDAELQAMMAVAKAETGFGSGWKPPGANSNNWGAIHGAKPVNGNCPIDTFAYKDSKPMPDGTQKLYVWCFKRYSSPLHGAQGLAKVMFKERPSVLKAADSGDILAFSTAMRETVYYEGVGKTKADQIRWHASIINKMVESIVSGLNAEGVPIKRALFLTPAGEKPEKKPTIVQTSNSGLVGLVGASAAVGLLLIAISRR